MLSGFEELAFLVVSLFQQLEKNMDNGHNNNELSILCEQKDMQQQHSPKRRFGFQSAAELQFHSANHRGGNWRAKSSSKPNPGP